jgi:PAS domain-containing protein
VDAASPDSLRGHRPREPRDLAERRPTERRWWWFPPRRARTAREPRADPRGVDRAGRRSPQDDASVREHPGGRAGRRRVPRGSWNPVRESGCGADASGTPPTSCWAGAPRSSTSTPRPFLRFGARESRAVLEAEGVFTANSFACAARTASRVPRGADGHAAGPSERGRAGGAVSVMRDVSRAEGGGAATAEERGTLPRDRRARRGRVLDHHARTENAIEYVSPAYEIICGVAPPEELYLDSPMRGAESIVPQDRERVLAAARTGPTSVYDQEYRIRRPDGEERWIWDRSFPVRNAGGRTSSASSGSPRT